MIKTFNKSRTLGIVADRCTVRLMLWRLDIMWIRRTRREAR